MMDLFVDRRFDSEKVKEIERKRILFLTKHLIKKVLVDSIPNFS